MGEPQIRLDIEPAGLDLSRDALRLTVSRNFGHDSGLRAVEEPTMIPDYLIIDEIRRRQEDAWEPEPLQLPLYVPHYPQGPEEEEPEEEPSSKVIIIDMTGD